MVRVIQSLNQNALLLTDDNGKEIVGLGKGIGFGKKKGDRISKEKISRFFVVGDNDKQDNRLVEIVSDIDERVIEIAEDVVRLAEEKLGQCLSSTFIITLSQHIQFQIARSKEDNSEYNVFEYQLRYLYPDEYKLAVEVIRFINEKYHLDFKKQEVSFFTLHFVNALIDSENFSDLVALSEMLNKIIAVLKYNALQFQMDTVEYSRFVVHLRYLLIRLLTAERKNNNEKFMELFYLTREMYPEESVLVAKVKDTLLKDYNLQLSNDEELFLLLHLVRMIESGG